MDDEQHSVAIAAIVLDGQERLLLMKRRDHGNWEPPGGVMKLGESISDAAVREVREETGLTVSPGHVTGVYKDIGTGVVTIALACAGKGDVTTTDEAAEVDWCELEDAASRLREPYLEWVRDARKAGPLFPKEQTGTVKGASSSPAG
jgi:ADP-ribose pyrophosphatase YjhB (NUDIX family)